MFMFILTFKRSMISVFFGQWWMKGPWKLNLPHQVKEIIILDSKNLRNSRIFFSKLILSGCRWQNPHDVSLSRQEFLFLTEPDLQNRGLWGRAGSHKNHMSLSTPPLAVPTHRQHVAFPSCGLRLTTLPLSTMSVLKWKGVGGVRRANACATYRGSHLYRRESFLWHPHTEEGCLHRIDQKCFPCPLLASRDPRMTGNFKWVSTLFIYNSQ